MTLLGGASMAWPLAARAQQRRRIGVLLVTSENDAESHSRIAAFEEGTPLDQGVTR